jgi:serum/glucocorticoid-regulated kinase 2
MDPNLRLEGGGTGSTESELTKLGTNSALNTDVTRICQFCTAQKHIPTDYYLSLPTNPLNVFAGMHLFL